MLFEGKDVSQCIQVSGAGCQEVNGIYHHVAERPYGLYAKREVMCNYYWAKEGKADSIIIYRENRHPHTWGIAVDGEYFYVGGGDGMEPTSMTEVCASPQAPTHPGTRNPSLRKCFIDMSPHNACVN